MPTSTTDDWFTDCDKNDQKCSFSKKKVKQYFKKNVILVIKQFTAAIKNPLLDLIAIKDVHEETGFVDEGPSVTSGFKSSSYLERQNLIRR